MINRHLYKDCTTGREVMGRFIYLERLKDRDIANAEGAHDNYYIHKLMEYYTMPYKYVAKEFYRYGMNRMGCFL